MTNELAIVIPAIKAQFLFETINSIANQSCKDFTLYIGDDASPEDIKGIVCQFCKALKIEYHRFNQNTGSHDLAKQWERCINLSSEEEYIWLFSDDDIMPPNAVELFYKTIRNKKCFDLYRFNIRQINETGEFISGVTDHPKFETVNNFIYRRIKGETLSSACEYIFSREIYVRNKGFVHFPLAWCSDDASWYCYGKQRGIYTLQGETVLWRISSSNISKPGKDIENKYKATLMYYKWINNQHLPEEFHNIMYYGLMRQINILDVNIFLLFKYTISLFSLLGIFDASKVFFKMIKRQIK